MWRGRQRRFADRTAAGRQLGRLLAGAALDDPLVLGLPRGGVPVAAEVARALGATLDVFVARKIGAPGRPELGVGAIAEGGEPVFDADLLARLGLTAADLTDTVGRERAELDRRVRHYRGVRTLRLAGRGVVLVDDGLATGASARAALRALRSFGAGRLLLGVPVGPPSTLSALAAEAAEVVAVLAPARLSSVGEWYDDFAQTSDETVLALLAQHRGRAWRTELPLASEGRTWGMRALSEAAHGQLELTRVYRRRVELRAGEEVVGTLERQSWWRMHVLLVAADGRWMLRQAGWMSRDAVLTTAGEATEREVGRYRARWRGDGTLTLTGGRELQLSRPRGWRMSRALSEGNSELVGLRPHGIKGRVGVTVAPAARDEPLLPLLVLFACQILVSDQAAASSSGAVTSG